jgi:cell division protein FtsB
MAALSAQRGQLSSVQAEVQQLQQRRDALAAEVSGLQQLMTQVPALRAEQVQLSAQLVETRETVVLQEAGIYQYRHPLDDAIAYKARLAGEDFLSPRKLRVSGQASRDGYRKVALKHRKPGEFRDVPVPPWLWELVKDLPEGPLCPGNGRTYKVYASVHGTHQRTAKRAGIPAGFTPHSLRHAFASALLGRLVPITDVARWLGHRDINITYAIYSHFMPDAEDRAISVLDAEYAEWSAT